MTGQQLDLRWDDLPHRELAYDPQLLNLRWTLKSGQAFRWVERGGWWTGVVGASVLRIRLEGRAFQWAAYPELPYEDFWERYLRLDFDLAGMYRDLGEADPHLRESIASWTGMRVMMQDPLETILSFLCTTANSIPRITHAIARMSEHWGTYVGHLDGAAYHSFPPLEALALDNVAELERVSGLGYRAANLARAAEQIAERPTGWADSLRSLPYPQAKAEMTAVRGIGRKIADCVALFALGQDEAVPVDTHVRQLAVEFYLPDLRTKSLTDNAYNLIAGRFRELFGGRAGWAQQYLFMSHLHRHTTPPAL